MLGFKSTIYVRKDAGLELLAGEPFDTIILEIDGPTTDRPLAVSTATLAQPNPISFP